MNLAFRAMIPDDLPATFDVRLSTVENAITMERLESDYGVTPERMADAMARDVKGWLCEDAGPGASRLWLLPIPRVAGYGEDRARGRSHGAPEG